jgi:hypothetical protein
MYYISSAAGVGVAIAMQKAFNHESASNTDFNQFLKKDHSRLMMRLLAITLIQSQRGTATMKSSLRNWAEWLFKCRYDLDYPAREKPLPTNMSRSP